MPRVPQANPSPTISGPVGASRAARPGRPGRFLWPLAQLLALATVLMLQGCGDAGDGRSSRSPTAPPEAALVALEPAVPERDRSLLDRVLARAATGGGDWPGERLARDLERQLAPIMQSFERREAPGAESLVALLDPRFACDPLRPAELHEVYSDRLFSVRRGKTGRPSASGQRRTGADGLARELAALLEALGASEWTRAAFEIHRIEVGTTEVVTSASVEIAGAGRAGGVEQHAEWILRWSPVEGAQAPRLRSIELADFEEVRLTLPGGVLFRDHTAAALGGTPAYAEQVLRGAMHWAERISRLDNVSIFGHAGLAVGDVNGDGLDDLYVCDDGGLPDRLYVQQVDGTLRDVSAEAGVDWLERSFSALLVDLDNDGDRDLAVATYPRLLLCENDGRGRFTVRARLTAVEEAYALTAADYDNDGYVDLYATTYGGGGHGAQDGDGGSRRPADYPGGGAGGHMGELAARSVFDPVDEEPDAALVAAQTDESRASVATELPVPEAADERSGDPRRQSAGHAGGHAGGHGGGGGGAPVPYHDANNGGPNALLRNLGEFRFVDVTRDVGLARNNTRFSFAAAWDDYDNDGDLDLYVANDFGRNNLYRNDGGRFTDVAAAAGVEDVGAGMSVSWGDYDGDGFIDLYVGNMYSAIGLRIAHQPEFARGQSPPDIELLRRTARGNSLFTNLAGRGFRDDSLLAGVNMGRWAWSSNFVDLNGDGRQDLVVANGFLSGEQRHELNGFFWTEIVSRTPGPQAAFAVYQAGWDAIMRLVRQGKSWSGYERNRAYLNTGTARFAGISALSGLDFDDDARAVALVDWDHDGDVDLWLRNRTAPRLRLMLNATRAVGSEEGWVAFRLRGTTCNRDAIGARVTIELSHPSGRSLAQTLRAGEGFRAQSSQELHFGLGAAARIAGVSVRWPGGATERFAGVVSGRRYVLTQGSGTAVASPPRPTVVLPPTPLSLPPESRAARIVLSRRLPTLALPFSDLQSGSHDVVRTEGGPTLLQLWAVDCAPCDETLARWAAAAEPLRRAGIRVLALSVPAAGSDVADIAEKSRSVLEALSYPWPAGVVAPELMEKLELLEESLLGRAPPFAVPQALLLDRGGRIAVIYRGDPGVDRLLEDLDALDLSGEALRAAALPFAGRWYTRFEPVESYLPSIAETFRRRYPEDAVRMLETSLAYHEERRARETLTARQQLRSDATLADTRYRLASLLAEQREFEQAVGYYRQAVALAPERADARNGLGVALSELGAVGQALEHFRAAVHLDPRDPEAHNNLGLALYLNGRFADAVDAYRNALRLDSRFAEAHYNLGVLLSQQNHRVEALQHFRDALSADPDAPGPLTEAAWILATDPDPRLRGAQEAVRLAHHAAELTGHRDATILDTLAAAHAAAARYDEAVRVAQAALALAERDGDRELARYVRSRLELYRRGMPFRDAPTVAADRQP